MKLQDLIRRFRTEFGDKAEPYFWGDEEVTDFLNDGQVQACKRGRLLREDALPAMCEIVLVPGQQTYALHAKLYEIIDLRLHPGNGGRSRPVDLKSREWLNEEFPDWRDSRRPACMAVQDETTLRLVGFVEPGDKLVLEAYRLPLRDMCNPSDKPEIHEASHVELIQWALYRAFSIPDADTFDGQRAAVAEQRFTDYFGLPVDSDLRRETRVDNQHYVRGYLA